MNFPTTLKRIPAPIQASWQGCVANVFRAVFILGLSSFLFPISDFRFPISDLSAAPVAYSGKISVDGENFDGPGHFRFQLVDHNGSVLWQNAADGAAVTTAVHRGHYSVLLGDDATPHMAAIPNNLFLDHPVVFLRVHFSQGDGQPFVHLQPDQRILSAAHALSADSAKVADGVRLGGITSQMLSPEVLAALNASIANGSITTDMLSPAVLAELNQPLVITRGDLPADVLADLNASITLGRLSPEVLAALGVLPSISTQPFALYDGATNTARFEVSGHGHQLSYQWLKDGQPINGATAPVLEIANALLDDNATYAVRITNFLGEANSQTLTLQDAIGAPGHPLAEANATDVPRAGLVLWMDALDLNADGHADNVLLGDRISSWTDKVTDKNATQAEWGKQPVKTANAVSFDGSNDFLKITDLNVTAQHIFIVAKRRPASSGFGTLLAGRNVNNSARIHNSLDYFHPGYYGDFTYGTGGGTRVSAGPNSLTDNLAFVATLTVGAEGSDNGVFLDLYLGATSATADRFDGEIHEVLFYDRLLQDAERDAVEQYLAGKWGVTFFQDIIPPEPENGLVAYYKFEPVSGWTDKLWDFSGNENHLTMVGFDDDPWAEGVAGDALAFDGLNDYASGQHPDFNTRMKTVAFWAKPEVVVDGREDPNYVVNFDWGGHGNRYFAFNHALRGGSGHWFLGKPETSPTPWPTVETNATFDQDFHGWFHVALVATQPDGTSSYDFYANGNKLDTVSTDPTTGFLGTYPLRLGYGVSGSKYKGRLDEFRIYDRILAPAEIEALFNSYQNPIVRTDGEHNATVGTNFSLSLAADNGPTTYLAEGLPAGLSLNVVTGEISGTLSQPGYHRVFVKAMNEYGTGSSTIAIVARPQTDENGWPVDVPDGSDIPQNGIVLWLDANDVDADGQIDTGTDFLKLANWVDKAGHDHNASQTTAFRQPEIRADQLPERPALNLLVFDGNQSLAFPPLNNGRTFFWVVNRGTGNDQISSFFGLNGTSNWGYHLGGRAFYQASSYIGSGLTRRDGEVINFYNSGSFHTQLQVITVRTTDFQPADLIGKKGNAENYFTGNIGEMLIYDRALTETEIETVEKYLGHKWGIAISHDDTPPVAGNPPTFQVSPAAGSVTAAMLTDEVKTFLAPRMVTQPPAQVTGYAERSIHIPAVADGRQLSYQWQRAGQPVAGATSPILHLADLNASTDPGSYSLVVTNPFGSVTSSATQLTVATVVPNDVDLPVLTLNGQKSISLLTGTAWQEPGFSATDDLDGNLTAVVDVNGTVDVATPGAYFITYKATDSAGNFATAQRVVTVSNFTDMILIPAGTFQMGNPGAVPPSNYAQHEVYLSAYYVGKYELTQTIWDEVRLWATDPARGANVYQFDNNGTAEGPDHPVANVSWYDMIKWCNARSEKENLQPLYYRESNQTTLYRSGQISLTNDQADWQANGWRLPTEAEWEKAAKGGLVGMDYPHGNAYSSAYGNIIESGIGKTVPIGGYPANGYGLHDAYGNVAERHWDGYQVDWYLQPEASLPNTRGREILQRSIRGSSFGSNGWGNLLWVRGGHNAATKYSYIGFRLARNAPDAVAGGYPTLTSSPDANSTAGQAFSYQILAGNSPVAYGATGLPAGLSVNTSTGLITGFPTTVGDHNATISATNAAGTTSMSLGITISSGVSVPLAAGSEYTLFVDENGTLWAVGNNSGSRLGDGTITHRFSSVKVFDQNVTAVSAGTQHSFVIDRKGALWGMGQHADGRLGITAGAPFKTPTLILDANVSFVSAGHEHSMFVKKDGSLWGMGRNHYGQLGDGGVEDRYFTPFRIVEANVTAVDVGFSQHSLFLKSDGSLWAVGRNNNGQLGDGTTVDRNSSFQVVEANATAIAAGSYHSLFLKADGSLWGMGNNQNGRLGDGTVTNRTSPVKVVEANVTAIAAGSSHSLFITKDHTLWAMGLNTGGRLGDGTTIERHTPVQIDTNVMRVAAGKEHSVYQKFDGSLWTVGNNYLGPLNDGTIILRNSPEEFVDGNVTAVSAGKDHGLLLKTNGSLWSVGSNNSGKLGNGSQIHSSIPLQILGGNVTGVSGGGDHSLFLKADGSLWAMGHNGDGQLGDQTTTHRFSPIRIVDANVSAMDAQSNLSLFIKNNGSLWAMGRNQYGQLGDGSTVSRTSPVQIVDANVTVVSTGHQHSLFIKSDGSLWGMGRNIDGRLGDGTTTNRLTPVRSIDSNVTAVATGLYFSLILKSDGSLWGMGYNNQGQLGDGTTSSRATPVQIVESGVTSIAAGDAHSFFVKDNGSLWAMGFNAYGQLGDGTTIDRHAPVQVLSSGVAEVSAGQYFTLVRMTDGSLRSMGLDQFGQLGSGRTFYRTTAVQVASGLPTD